MPLPKLERDPLLSGVLTGTIEKRLLQVHTCIPAKVDRWDPVKGLVDAKPLVMAYKRGEDGERIAYPLPVVTDALALFLGAGGYRQTFPVEVGDFALLLFAETSLDVWMERGVDVDPQDERRHHLSDGIALLGLRPATSPWTGLESPACTWGKDGGLQIHINVTQILLGGEDATEAAAIASKTDARLSHLEAAFNAHVHPTAAVGPPSPPTPVLGIIPVETALPVGPGVVGTTASSTVKIKP